MKRVVLISSAVVIGALSAISFTSCKKKEGVYNPEGKISKVYYEDYTVHPNDPKPDFTVPRELVEVWTWDKKKLLQIESKAHNWALQFVYKGNQVQEIMSGNDVFKFSYEDKSKLKKIELLDDKSRPVLNITVDDRNGDEKITKLTYEQFTYTETEEKSLLRKLRPVVNIMMGENVGETMIRGMEENAKMRKATTTTKVTTQVELTYNGNNISEEKRTIVQENVVPQTIIIKYKHDNKSNPYYQAFALMYDFYASSAFGTEKLNALFATTSENNIESYAIYNADKPEEAVDSVQFVYKYNGDGYPTERDKVKEHVIPTGGDSTRFVTHTVFHYEYVTK